MKLKLNYFIIPLISLATLLLGGWFTAQEMNWYHTINLPSYTPSGMFISWMWRIIYTLTTLSVLIVWNTFERNARFNTIITLFIINAILNALWTCLFFYNHMIGAAIIDAGALALNVYTLIYLIWPISSIAALLLVPYAGWVTFATYLNYAIWLLNR